MKYKQYSPQLWSRIRESITQAKDRDATPVAAFDADGTLWDTDFGENFFQYKIDRKLVPLPADPWNYYVSLKQKNNDPREAYLWLAQILKGLPIDQVRQWADEAVKQHAPPIFSEQKLLIEELLKAGVQVYVITASVKWAVEPGARLMGLTNENVLGVETAVENGLVTDKAAGFMTYRQGKTDALLNRTGGKRPFFCSGNTEGDLELLQSSTDLRLAVSAAARDEALFKKEDALQKIALQNGWLSHRFVPGS